ncbi:MAG: YjbH domain-containing protein [bacterium]
MTVPTARMQPDGSLAIGFGYIPRPHSIYGNPGYDNLAAFASVGFLPFLEVSLRVTHALNDRLTDIGDRMASVRVRVLQENRKCPALVLGLHDLVAIQGRQGWFNALYAVLTKNISVSNHLIVETTAGYGVKWMKARAHEFAGLWGGLSMGYGGLFFIKAEYDTHKFNYGLALHIAKFLTATLVLLDGKTAAYGVNIQIQL